MTEEAGYDWAAFPILTTERLVLRDPRVSDAADVLVFRGDPEVQMFNDEVMTSVAEVTAFIEHLRAEVAAHKRLIWAAALRPAGPVIGLVGLGDWSKYHRRAEAGYDLARTYWGQGLGAEAVRAMLRYGFETLALHRIEAATIADNTRSARMLERLGFRREGTRREYSWEDDGRFHDSAMYGLLAHEFAAA
jgi:ribosomal-protein-alanine N-acetyltransferase